MTSSQESELRFEPIDESKRTKKIDGFDTPSDEDGEETDLFRCIILDSSLSWPIS